MLKNDASNSTDKEAVGAFLRSPELFGGVAPEAAANAAYVEGRYGLESRLAVYERLVQKARSIVREGRSVIVDGAFLSGKSMAIVAAALNGCGVDILAIHCACSDEIAMKRIAARSDKNISEARPEFVALQRAEWERAPSNLGIATGATMHVAIRALRAQHPKWIVVAVPIAPPTTCDELAAEVYELVCLLRPEPLHGVGNWYYDFPQTTDAEVRRLLAESSETVAMRAAAEHGANPAPPPAASLGANHV